MAIRVAAVVVAAGRGTRAGLDFPKQYKVVGGTPMVRESLCVFTRAPAGRSGAAGDPPRRHRAVRSRHAGSRLASPVPGAATRQGSVRAGLEALRDAAPAIVLVHDAARPFASQALVSRAIAAAEQSGAAVPGLAVTDTVKLVDEAGQVAATIARSALRTVQTPQAFAYPALLDAHRRAAAEGPRGFSRRCRAGRMGGPAGDDIRR